MNHPISIGQWLQNKKNSKRLSSKDKTLDRDNSLRKGNGQPNHFSTIGWMKSIGSHSKKIKYKNIGNSNMSVNYSLSHQKSGGSRCKIPAQQTYDVRGII